MVKITTTKARMLREAAMYSGGWFAQGVGQAVPARQLLAAGLFSQSKLTGAYYLTDAGREIVANLP